MAQTPKPIRRAIKRARISASRMLGVKIPVRARMGNEDVTRRTVRHGRVSVRVELSPQITEREAFRRARHEFVHAGYDYHSGKKGGAFTSVISEALATLSNAELLITESPKKRDEFINAGIRRWKLTNPTNEKERVHKEGLRIALNILHRFPQKKERRKWIRFLARANAEKLRNVSPGKKILVTEIGEIIGVQAE